MITNRLMAKSTAFLLLIVLVASFASAINVNTPSDVSPSVVKPAVADHLLINEFMIQPGESESIELYNPTGSEIGLSTWILSDRPLPSATWPSGEGNMTLSGSIAAGGYKVFYPSDSATWGEDVLGNEGDDLYLYNETSPGTYVLVDSVAYGPMGGCPEPEYGWSACRAPDGVDTDDDAADWNVNASTGDTMGSLNNAPPAALCESPIVINEVLANPSGVPEFIELYNNGSVNVNITWWFFSDGDDMIVINVSSTVPAHGFWVAYSNDSFWEAAIYTYGLDNYEDNVYLFNSTGHRLDQMGWTSNHGDGTSLARFSDGMGQCYAYDDTTFVVCGWAEERRRNGSPGSSNDCTHLWVDFYASPSTVRQYMSNYTLVKAAIANMKTTSTSNVNLTLTLPVPNVTITDPVTNDTEVQLGTLTAYEIRTVVWNVTANVTGFYLVNLTVTAEIEPDPRPASTGILSLPRVDIVFDDSHSQYYDWPRMPTFRGFLEQMGFVYRNTGRITDEILEGVTLLVLPSVESAFIANETEVIKKFVDDGGSLLILGYGWWEGGHFSPEIQNNITAAYGINFTETHIYDNNDNTGQAIWTVCKTWADNDIATYLTYGVQKMSSGRACMLNITKSGPVPIGTGDTDPGNSKTYAERDGVKIAEGTDIIVHAAVETAGGGRIFATGSATIFCDASYYMQYEQGEQFARNIIGWLMRPVTNVEVECSLQSLYNVSIKGNLTVAYGHNLTVAFYSYANEYQANTTISWAVTTQPNVTFSANVSHPLGLPVEKVMLVLTDEDGNTWGGFKFCVVSRSDLSGRVSEIDIEWPAASASDRQKLFKELVAIDLQWPYAPP